jgi:hypothetical protein
VNMNTSCNVKTKKIQSQAIQSKTLSGGGRRKGSPAGAASEAQSRRTSRPKEESAGVTTTNARTNWHSVRSVLLDLNIGHFSLEQILAGCCS